MEEKQITLQIDGHFITVPEGSTILEAAIKIGINIPTLCHIDLKGTCIKNNPASCRICVVEVMGRRNLAPACATPFIMPEMKSCPMPHHLLAWL